MLSNKFFDLDIPGDQYAVARAAEHVSLTVFPRKSWVSSWTTPQFFIPKNDGIISDYMFSDVEGRLCSDKLKKVIESNKAECDIIQWLPVDIFVEDTGETLRYHHLHFPEPPDCLSRKHCKYNPASGRVMVPFYSFKKMIGRHIFNSSGGYETTVTLVSKDMLKVLEKAECTGLSFETANVIYDEEEPKQAAS